ncbi:hypothetical protein GI374_09730 [Paracoccus sp. S-4012]|uniref:hypothetical protein n=1 Tax=Paracoccus sp. S-4012 TaxID=2665648 RepID=UPI0012AF9FFC|nr:hypothetical protein [Paracoccus sp. S-4012]MRX50719.1 hypothetical protein [Paracoccus sp. S-4012]
MRSVLALSAAALTLAGCAYPVVAPAPVTRPPVVVTPPSTVSTATRSAAITVINREMAARLPGTNVAPYTTCVVNNANQAELADLASMSGNSAAASSAVAAIVQRPAATQCIASIARTA